MTAPTRLHVVPSTPDSAVTAATSPSIAADTGTTIPCGASKKSCKSSNIDERSETAWFIETCRAAGITSAKAIAVLCDLPGELRANALIYDRTKITADAMTAAFRKRPDLLLEYARHCGCMIIFNKKLLAAAEQFARIAKESEP